MYNPMIYGNYFGGGHEFFGPFFMLMIVFAFFVSIAIYVYTAFAWMTIAKKLKYKYPWLAWIPLANFFLLPILAKKEWQWGFILLVPIANIVFAIIWLWAIYERRKYPGWLSLIPLACLIPTLNWFACAANLVIFGLVAWKNQK